MKIQTKLMVLLLAVSLLPMLAIVFLARISIQRLSSRISNDIQSEQLADSIHGLGIHVHNYKELVTMAGISARLTLEVQAREVEKRLAESDLPDFTFSSEMKYGLDTSQAKLVDNKHIFYPPGVSFQSQGVFLAEGTKISDVEDDLSRLATMTQVCHALYHVNQGDTLWHYTTLENGLHTSYPGGGTLPPPTEYDPRSRPWYLRAKNEPESRIPIINVDAVTKQLILTFSMPVYRPDGQFAGVTSIDKAMKDIFGRFLLPAPYKGKIHTLLAGLGGTEEEITDRLLIYLHKQDTGGHTSWKTEIDLPELISSEKDSYHAMLEDIKAEKAGSQIMPYNGQKSLWIYSERVSRKAVLIMIVPFDIISQLAEQTQKTIVGENIRQLWKIAPLIFVIIAVTIALSILRSRKFTNPIGKLTVAANNLADGDFAAQADIVTGDELQQLAEVFNQVGPKLREHEKTQRSLALARTIQQNLLPQQAPKLSRFDIVGCCRYCDETGGDYFDFIPLRDNEKEQLGIVLGDVTGHGVGAALLMASARGILRNASGHFNGNLPALMAEFNNQLSEATGDDKFITLFYGVLDDEKQSLFWASGGHDPAIWYHQKEDTFEELPNTGALMGFLKDMTYEQAGPIVFEMGDILIVGTDGIWEAQNPAGQFYGKDKLRDLIKRHAKNSANHIASSIISSVGLFTAPDRPTDDVTLIVVKAL